MGYNIAIDGPAGAGKSTIAKKVARELGYIYVDTGAMYRAMAVYFRECGLTAEDLDRMKEVCTDAEIVIRYENGSQQVYLNGENVTGMLREEAIGRLASVGSALPEVRTHLLELQRKLARDYDVVMDGRDIGTNILPQADAKIYLTASVRTRAERRFKELWEAGQPCILEEIEKDIRERDERDMTRETAPLKQAKDAVLVDSSEMTIDEVVQTILAICR